MNNVFRKSRLDAEHLENEMLKIGVGMEGGGPVEHQTGAFGQAHPEKIPERKEYLSEHIQNEDGMKRRLNIETGKLIEELEKLDSSMPSIQGGFGRSDLPVPKPRKHMEDDINNEVYLQDIDKTQSKYISSGNSYTDINIPKDDAFYLPSDISDEAIDEASAEEMEEGKIMNDGRVVKRQGFNTGGIENAQIGNQGISDPTLNR
ncbi:MAG: hypothetical protein WC175_04145 [Candidatus Dojkabacteria bacterium]